MPQITINIKNGDRIINAFRKAPEEMAKELQQVLIKLGVETTRHVKDVIVENPMGWPPPKDRPGQKPLIRTGAMRRGIQVRQTLPMKVIIMPSEMTPYAKYVHDGTRFMTPRPFFNATAIYKQKQIAQFFERSIDSAVKRIMQKAK